MMNRALVVVCAALGLAASAAISGCDPVTGEQMRDGQTVQVDTAVPSQLKSCCDELDKETEVEKTQVAANSAGSAYEPVYPALDSCCGGQHGQLPMQVHAAEPLAGCCEAKAKATCCDEATSCCDEGGCEKSACEDKGDCDSTACDRKKDDCGQAEGCLEAGGTAPVSIEKPLDAAAGCCSADLDQPATADR